ncbi:hypothetical protein CRG98_010094 [Punica granatum]|uniref:Uncharacterized protein n=1 Tax=Punica granatum TaxID=22663 RepID=A0A2I0KM34_PUNGR|nr:hypothetical protein CRG98_010094 [Punica granatum]
MQEDSKTGQDDLFYLSDLRLRGLPVFIHGSKGFDYSNLRVVGKSQTDRRALESKKMYSRGGESRLYDTDCRGARWSGDLVEPRRTWLGRGWKELNGWLGGAAMVVHGGSRERRDPWTRAKVVLVWGCSGLTRPIENPREK